MNRIFTVTLNPAVDREMTVPDIAFNQVLRAEGWQVDFGGKGFNVSRMLRSLGADSTAIGFAGGKSGELLQEGLESLGVQMDFVWIAGDTRTNVSIVTTNISQYIKVNEPGPTVTGREQRMLVEKVARLCEPGDWWILAGSLPPGIPPTYYRNLIEVIREKGARVILDTSGEALALGCEAFPDWVKPNETELQSLTDMPTTSLTHTVAAARSLQTRGIANALVSMGKRGAVLVGQEGAWQLTTPSVIERNPIGAGDSLVGGLVWGLSRGLDRIESARWGLACGAAAASLNGTAVGSREQVESLFSQTCAKPMVF